MAHRVKKDEQIFAAAIQIDDEAARRAFVMEACKGDTQLQANLEALLQAHASPSLLDASAIHPTVTLEHPLSESPGMVIGRYKLLEKIGEGGMAVVYMAEQERPIRRKVALKIIKLGMDTRQVIARFEAERQALALMDHPNIAKVLDAGATDTGRPYFVMELVTGISITDYSDKNKLGTEDRLDLFIQVCHAVQHAHQKGIIHRDIKPTNILVTRRNGTPVPKVIDFGIAKATNQRLTEKTLFTRYAHIIGTPAYMSPEQAELSEYDIDTRSDIYSLGVLLYELLTGTTPFTEEELRQAGYAEMTRIIRDKEPQKPSTRLTQIQGKTSPQILNLKSKIENDLDWIVMKTLEKDRARRYETADALGMDIQRHLNSEPILARSPSSLYRLHKLIQRNRVPIAGALLCVTILAGILLMWHQVRKQLAEADLSRARACFIEGDRRSATELVQPILDSKHVGPAAQLLYAGILVEDRRYDEALATVGRLVDKGPEIAGAAHAIWARILWESVTLDEETLKKTNEHQQKAQELLPSDMAEGYFLQAMTAITIKDKLDLLDEAIRLDPTHYESFRMRAFICSASRKYEEMKEDAIVMVSLRPRDSLGFALRASARFELGQYDRALEDYDHAISLVKEDDPQYAKLTLQRCDVLLHMEKYEQLINEAPGHMESVSDRVQLEFRVFCAWTALGRYEEAAACWRRLLRPGGVPFRTLKDWARKRVFDMRAAGRSWHAPDTEPVDSAFLAMLKADITYGHLSKKARRIVKDAFTASWSPDGTKLAYSAGFLGYSGIAVYDLRTDETDLLIVPGKDPAWSPDGQSIAFVRDRRGLPVSKLAKAERLDRPSDREGEELWIMSADGTEPKRLASGGWPSWSQDSQRLYYKSHLEKALYRVSLGDSSPTPEYIVTCPFHCPSVSPDERYLAYFERSLVKILELDTRLPVSHWPLGGASMWAGGAWSPKSTEFALAGGGYGAPDWRLRVFDVATGQPESVLAGPVGTAKWSQDGTKLVFTLSSPFAEVWITDDLGRSGSTATAFRPNLAAYDQDILTLYTRAIEANPEDENGLYIRAQHYQYLGDVNSAQADMNRYALVLGRQAPPSGFRFGPVENLGAIVNSSTYEIRPLPSDDGLALMFGRRNPEGVFDSWLATRHAKGRPWRTLEKLSLGRPDVYVPCVTTEDGLEFYHRILDQYGFGDLAVSKRDSVDDDWGPPENLGPIVNSPAYERRPAITADGLELYFMDHYSGIRPGGCGEMDLWMTTRPTRRDPWKEPMNLGPPVNSSSSDGWPYISPDGLLLMFASLRPGGFGQGDVYATWRASRDDPWEEPVNLGPGVNTRGGEWAPCLSSDRSTLYFESNRPGVYGEMDLWQVPVLQMKR